MTDKQPAQFDWATELSDAQGRVTLSEQEAHEIGARLRSLGAKLKAYEDLGDAADDMASAAAQGFRDGVGHVQNPAENEHVAGDVSKNGAELDMSAQQEVQEPVAHVLVPYYTVEEVFDASLTPQPAPQQEAREPLTDSQIMASIGRNAGKPNTLISESRPLGQQWDQVCNLVRDIFRERYAPAPKQEVPAQPTEAQAVLEAAHGIGIKGGQHVFLESFWKGFQRASIACGCAACIIFMAVGIGTTIDMLAGKIPAACIKGGQHGTDT